MIPATLWTAIVTLLIGLFYFYTGFRVGNLRGKHKIMAPATSGHPKFDRAYRVQLNTLEQMGIFLPLPMGGGVLSHRLGLARAADRLHLGHRAHHLPARLHGRSQQTADRGHDGRSHQPHHVDYCGNRGGASLPRAPARRIAGLRALNQFLAVR